MISEPWTAMSVEPLLCVRRAAMTPERFERKNGYGRNISPCLHAADTADVELEKAWAEDCTRHQRNLPAIEHNKKVRNWLVDVMKGIGIPDFHMEADPKSRARVPKMLRVPAGYIKDIGRHLPITDNFDVIKQEYERRKRAYADYRKRAEIAAVEKERAAEAERKLRKQNVALARVVIRYGLPDDSAWHYVLEALRERDKYLDLAIAMLMTRQDWNDGPYLVSNALDRFKVETDQDAQIVKEISGHLDDWCGDGRIFRDCEWCYTRLFEMVEDKQLLKDAQEALEMAGN